MILFYTTSCDLFDQNYSTIADNVVPVLFINRRYRLQIIAYYTKKKLTVYFSINIPIGYKIVIPNFRMRNCVLTVVVRIRTEDF